MNIFTLLYIIITSAAALLFCIMAFTMPHKSKLEKNSKLKARYIKQLVNMLGEITPSEQITARGLRQRMALAEAIYIVVSHTYGIDTDKLKQVTQINRLERFLSRAITFSRGIRRSHLLLLMSCLPASEEASDKLLHNINSRNSLVRTNALLATLALKPSHAIKTIASLDFELQHTDIARIIALLRRGLLPIAYEPLLESHNRNLRMLGIAIVRAFGINIAEKQLCHIIYTENDNEIATEALYTLATLGRTLSRTRIRERLATMPPSQRKDLCRHITTEGYSLQTMRSLFSIEESCHAEKLINSHKRKLTKIAATI